MANRFGPWATEIDAGSNRQLRAFWRRRLTMLVPVSRTNLALSRRSRLSLGAVLVLTILVPTLRFAPVVADEEKAIGRASNAAFCATAVTADDLDKEPNKTAARSDRTKVQESWELTLPDGTKRTMGLFTYTSPSSEGDKVRHEEIEKLICERKYELLRTFEVKTGEQRYQYRFTFDDGTQTTMDFSLPLDNVASWEDYARKDRDQRQQRMNAITKAVAAGRFRLIDLEVIQVHLCRDVARGQKLKVQRVPQPDGSTLALVRPDTVDPTTAEKRTSWQEHLATIRDGKRELLGLETVNSYTYEVLLDDGTKTLFNYGGGQLLKRTHETDK